MKKTARLVERCRLLMAGGGWWTLAALSAEVGCSEAAASARLRDLRKAQYGSHKIIRRHVGSAGRHVYRMLVRKEEAAI